MSVRPFSCPYTILVLLLLLATAAGFAVGAVVSPHLLPDETGWFPVMSAKALDGDSVMVEILVHVDDVNAPEIGGRCPNEPALAIAARDRLNALLSVPPTRIHIYESDAQGRVRAGLVSGDRNIANALVTEKHGVRMRGPPGQNSPWCPGEVRGDTPPNPIQKMLAWQ
jgi:hypothetical protein